MPADPPPLKWPPSRRDARRKRQFIDNELQRIPK
jgi:hypothetical protein